MRKSRNSFSYRKVLNNFDELFSRMYKVSIAWTKYIFDVSHSVSENTLVYFDAIVSHYFTTHVFSDSQRRATTSCAIPQNTWESWDDLWKKITKFSRVFVGHHNVMDNSKKMFLRYRKLYVFNWHKWQEMTKSALDRIFFRYLFCIIRNSRTFFRNA